MNLMGIISFREPEKNEVKIHILNYMNDEYIMCKLVKGDITGVERIDCS